MPTRKISSPDPKKVCRHPEHDIPMFQLFEPGTYEHTCPGCGNVVTFTVPERPTLYTGGPDQSQTQNKPHMSQKTRQGVFETNSSSTHSICIAKDVQPELPKSIHFEFGEFGWEVDTLDSTANKASYLYTGLQYNERTEDIEKMIATLEGKGIEVTKEEPKKDAQWSSDNGYIDHGNELNSFLDAVVSDEQALLSFLFSPLSFILTGNDNDEVDVDITVDYPHDEYYKGN